MYVYEAHRQARLMFRVLGTTVLGAVVDSQYHMIKSDNIKNAKMIPTKSVLAIYRDIFHLLTHPYSPLHI